VVSVGSPPRPGHHIICRSHPTPRRGEAESPGWVRMRRNGLVPDAVACQSGDGGIDRGHGPEYGHRVEPGERHLRRADLQRQDVVAKPNRIGAA
jgi:hypothetical protein